MDFDAVAIPMYPRYGDGRVDAAWGGGTRAVKDTKPSIWKREISFRRRRAEEPAVDDPGSAAAAEVDAGGPEPEPGPGKPSIWKREISFRRRRAEEPAEEEPEVRQEEEPGFVLPESWQPGWHAGDPGEPLEGHDRAAPLPAGDAPGAEPAHGTAEPAPVDPWPSAPAPAALEAPLDAEEGPRFEDEPAPRRRGIFSRRRSRSEEPEPEPEPVSEPAADGRRRSSVRVGRKRGVTLVGLKLGASQIAAAHVRNNGSIEVLKAARSPLDRGIVVSGELRDPDQLAEALRRFFKTHKLPKRNVRLGIGSNRVGVRVLDVVGVDDPKLLANAVRFHAQEVLPIPLSEAVLDYRVLREELDDDGETHRRVLVAFAYRELVDRYLDACRKAGVRLAGIDLEGFALLRALVDPSGASSRPAGAAVVTVSLGHDRSIMSVSDGETCEFTRLIEWGGSALDTAVARILALTPSQAEPTKRALTLDQSRGIPEGLNAEQASRARAAMLQEVNAFAREFVSSLQFYQGQPGSLDIGEIVVTGGTAHMPGLVEELQRLIGVGVRLGDPLVRVRLGKRAKDVEQVGSLALAIGLGIED